MKKYLHILLCLWCLVIFYSPHALKAETAPAADFLMPDGTLNAYAIGNQQLTLDLKGWQVALDPKRGPVFSPAPPPLADFWSALDMGLNGSVSAIAVNGSDIYVGGAFTDVGGTSVTGLNFIAKWNGTAWSALDMGLNGNINAIAVSGSDIYVGGFFTDVGGGTSVTGLNNIAKWNGTAWSALGQGLNNDVNAIAVSGSDIYAGGSFTDVGGGTTVTGLNNVAKWNGTAWSALDMGLSNAVTAIAVSGSDIYVGGIFTDVGGGTSVTGLNRIAKWNGTVWSALDMGLNGAVSAIAVSGSDIYVGGPFSAVGTGGTAVTGLNRIAKWNGTAWSALNRGLNGGVSAIAVSGSDIYAGGTFTVVGSGGTPVTGLNRIAKWNGTAWSALDRGLNSEVRAIKASGSNIYVGGGFGNVGTGGIAVTGLNNIAQWNVSAVLPVELLDFKATPSVSGNHLTWTTTNEVNNKGFQVERRLGNSQQATGDSWETLGFITAKNKSSSYQFLDVTPPSGAGGAYYRLRQMDNDGKETFSKVISISSKGSDKLKVYPNPVSNVLTVEYTEGGHYQIINLLGQQVSSGKAAQRIDVSVLPQGTYFLKLGLEQVKFIKE